jgi:hypothetical protein
MSEQIDVSDITVGGEPLMGNTETPAQEETNEPTQEPESVQEETFDDNADLESAESFEEVEVADEQPPASEEPLFSEEEMVTFNSGVSEYTEGNYESIDSLIEAHDTLYDQVEELQAKLEEVQNSTQAPEEQDEFIKGLIEYYKETGDVSAYIEAKNVDYSAMSDLDIVRRNMRSQYSDMSDKNFERLFRREVVDKYQLDASRYDEEEVELGEELLKAEASKLRSELIERQAKFKAPERQAQPEVDTTAQAEEAMAQWTEKVNAAPETQSVINDGRVVIDFNGEPFAYEIDNPQDVVDMTIDNNKFFQLFQNEGGQIDYNRWYKVMNYASDPDTFERSLILHGKNLGGKEVVSEIKNPSRPTKSSVSAGGDTKEDFLQAALRAMGK